MRVSSTGNNPVQSAEVSGAKQSSRATAAQEAKKADGAKAPTQVESDGATATISGRARDMAQAKAVAEGTPDVRDEKIAELKRRISAGNYHVDADKIADRMVDDHIKMSGIG